LSLDFPIPCKDLSSALQSLNTSSNSWIKRILRERSSATGQERTGTNRDSSPEKTVELGKAMKLVEVLKGEARDDFLDWLGSKGKLTLKGLGKALVGIDSVRVYCHVSFSTAAEDN
jgi:hypothetical protein